MAVHLIKLCVGCDSVADLEEWITQKLKEKKRRRLIEFDGPEIPAQRTDE